MDTDVNKQDEETLNREKYELAGHINESTSFIFSLVKRLSQDGDRDRQSVIVDMIVDEYRSARAAVDHYKKIGGESYSINRGMWHDVVGY